MSKSLTVDEKNIKEFLQSGAKNCFVIPDYQRAYEWNNKEIDLLFDDLIDFTKNAKASKNNENYFLGTILSHINNNNEREIIDGQQRLISLHLLLHVIYKKLTEQKKPSDKIKQRIDEIGPALWKKKNEEESEVDQTKIFIRSESIDDNYNDVLYKILTIGELPRGISCNYSKNYRRLKTKYNNLYNQDKTLAESFAYCLLNRTIIFSLEVNSRDAALTIFSKLNNRGKQLSSVNIFHAEIYKSLPVDKQSAFKDDWQLFIGRAEKQIGVNVEELFSQYMYYLRAQEGDTNSTLIGVRTYLTRDKAQRLKKPDILPTLERILNVWAVANKHEELDGEPWSEDIETLKIFDILLPFQNYTWRSASVIYYLEHGRESNFVENFRLFMRKLFAWYVPLYILNPDRTFIREEILKINVEILKTAHPKFKLPRVQDNERLKREIITSQYYRRLLLKSATYSHSDQTTLLPEKLTIDHLLPIEASAELFEQIGNVILIEQKFSQKPNEYINSEIAMTRDLIDEPDDWTPNSIAVRSNKIAESLINLWQRWSDEYDDN